jgi:NitT/TauT family transport system permease protein
MVSGPILLLGVWELLSRTERIDPRFWPPPTSLIPTARRLIESGELAEDIVASMSRILLGFVIASVPGVLFGLAMGLYRPVRLFLMPIAAAIYAVPKIAILPLVWIVLGTGESSKVRSSSSRCSS